MPILGQIYNFSLKRERERESERAGKVLEDCVRFEVSTAVTMKNGVFWDVTPCGSCKNRSFGGT
jgi:hypothetical protein